MIDEAQINNWFTYHAPDEDQRVKYEAIRAHAREFAHVINNLVPDSADKTTALRTLRESVMWANAAIATAPVGHSSQIDAPITPDAARGVVKFSTASPYQTASGFSSGGPVADSQETLEDVVKSFSRGVGA